MEVRRRGHCRPIVHGPVFSDMLTGTRVFVNYHPVIASYLVVAHLISQQRSSKRVVYGEMDYRSDQKPARKHWLEICYWFLRSCKDDMVHEIQNCEYSGIGKGERHDTENVHWRSRVVAECRYCVHHYWKLLALNDRATHYDSQQDIVIINNRSSCVSVSVYVSLFVCLHVRVCHSKSSCYSCLIVNTHILCIFMLVLFFSWCFLVLLDYLSSLLVFVSTHSITHSVTHQRCRRPVTRDEGWQHHPDDHSFHCLFHHDDLFSCSPCFSVLQTRLLTLPTG